MNDQVERVAKTLPVVLAGLYVVGFLIVALHLAGYGASSLDLIKVQYLAAGFWFCVLIAFVELFISPVHLVVNERIQHRTKGALRSRSTGELLRDTAFLTFLAVSTSIFSCYLVWRFGKMFSSEKVVEINHQFGELLYSTRFLVVPLVASDILVRVWVSLKEQGRDTPSREFSARRHRRIFAMLAIGVFVLCIELFSRDVYPSISFSLGGGQPRQVVFWLGPAVSDSFLQRDGTSPFTVPYELLLENENSFVVISPKDGQRAIEFDRKTVGAVVILGKRPRFAQANFLREVKEP